MLTRRLIVPALAALACLAAPASRAGSFTNAVLALNPVAYWPLTETAQPPASAVSVTVVNSGSLGTDFNAPVTGDILCGYPGALASGSPSADSFPGFNTRAEAPFTQLVSTGPPFTIETWILALDDGTYWGTTCVLSDEDATSPRSGWLIYMDIDNIGQYTFRTYNQNGTSTSLSLDLGAPGSIKEETWYHLAIVVSNAVTVTNVYAYINGALVAGPTALPGYVPDDGMNGGGFTMGDRSDNTGYTAATVLEEVAYYTNALDPATILAHYQAGTNPAPATPYPTLVKQSHPVLYYRMNEAAALSSPLPGGLPVAANLGSLGALANGFYESGTAPGSAGPTNSGFGTTSYACGFSLDNTQSTDTAGPGVICAPYYEAALDPTAGLTLTAWVQVPETAPGWFQTVVGRGNESYRLDVDTSSLPHFAANPNGDVVGTVPLDDGQWHFWAGVFDPVALVSILYIDGVPVAQASGSALGDMNAYLLIGGAPDYPAVSTSSWGAGRNFVGYVCHVAVFTNALSASQIQDLYNSAGGGPPVVSLTTSQFTVDADADTSITAAAAGTAPLEYQWYVGLSGVTNAVAGETNLTLSLTNVQPSQNNGAYFMVVKNAYGSVTSSVATLTVLSGPPQIQVTFPSASVQVPVGVPITFSVSATGTWPFSYQWYNGTTAIAGATNASYTFDTVAGTSTYGVTVSNSAGQTKSSTATLVGSDTPPPVITLNGNGTDWTINCNSSNAGITNDVLTLTDNVGSEYGTAFFNSQQYIDGFVAYFTYQMSATAGATPADGTTFCIQDTPQGVNAVGEAGGDLGYYGITNSAAFELNLYSGANGGSGIQFGTNGMTADSTVHTLPYFAPGSVSLVSGDPIAVRLYYLGSSLNLLMTDATAKTSYSAVFGVGLLRYAVGTDTAYVGFTAGTGGDESTQTITNFRFSYTTAPELSITRNGATEVISWPATVATFFVLQQSSSLAGPWTNVSTTPVVANGLNQVSVTPSGAAQFYRLELP